MRTRNRDKKRVIAKEPVSEHSWKYIKELKLQVSIKKGHTVKDWIIQYCRRNPFKKEILYKAYNIELN